MTRQKPSRLCFHVVVAAIVVAAVIAFVVVAAVWATV